MEKRGVPIHDSVSTRSSARVGLVLLAMIVALLVIGFATLEFTGFEDPTNSIGK